MLAGTRTPTRRDGADLVATSRFLSLVLRHDPGAIGLALDRAGWADVDDLLRCAAAHGRPLTRELLDDVVATNDKQRFAFSEDGRRVRANQGHSIDVDLGLPAVPPPAVLFHGTASRFVASILRGGLSARARQSVHLTEDLRTAVATGARHGVPVVLRVDAGRMAAEGWTFRRAANGVWLVDAVPARHLATQAWSAGDLGEPDPALAARAA